MKNTEKETINTKQELQKDVSSRDEQKSYLEFNFFEKISQQAQKFYEKQGPLTQRVLIAILFLGAQVLIFSLSQFSAQMFFAGSKPVGVPSVEVVATENSEKKVPLNSVENVQMDIKDSSDKLQPNVGSAEVLTVNGKSLQEGVQVNEQASEGSNVFERTERPGRERTERTSRFSN